MYVQFTSLQSISLEVSAMPSPALPQPNLRHLTRLQFRQQFRQHCSPHTDRLPRWLHRVWAWF
jgi:hypothetical protein